ncbi:hypothetical protein BJX65DRAFT_219815 [Aspergillus insuetus]
MTIIQNRLESMESHIRGSIERRFISPGCLQGLTRNQQANDECFRSLGSNLWSQRRHRKKWQDNETKKVISLVYRHAVCNRFLRYTVRASLTVTRSVGGYSISPSLQFRAIVPIDLPAFSLLMTTIYRLKQGGNNQPIIRDTRTDLFKMFDSGKASLYDTLQSGDTIMHAVAAWERHDECWESSQWADWRGLILDLSEAGLTPNCVNNEGRTPADFIARNYHERGGHENPARFAQTVDICSDLLATGSFMALDATWMLYHAFEYSSDGVDTHFSASGYGTLDLRLFWTIGDKSGFQGIESRIEPLSPLISTSVDELRLFIQQGVDFKGWLSCYAEWPAGLEILLQAGCKPHMGALAYACHEGYENSVSLMLQSKGFSLGQYALEVASSLENQRLSELIVEAVADRRKQLQLLVQTKLPADRVLLLKIRPKTLLDRQCFRAYQLLLAESIELNGLEQRKQYSVYDTENLSI